MSDFVMYRRLNDTDRDSADGEDTLPVWRKLCFALGGAPFQITNNVLGFFLNIFLLEISQIQPRYVSLVIFLSKVFDAFSDPTCGYLVNKSPPSRFGTLKPWILLSTPFTCTAYFFLFFVPDLSEEGKVAYYLLVLCLFQAGISVRFLLDSIIF
ncbi:sodium-dependent lysophosphatidylcholine symporter 1-B-like [Gigantopelta aegis]|uniref:sodium-dependent lysophosphatidylcholine symporter 1-B-like n=1 Tax=Gigantopelta aegis TaxID=1735272 RepID=UPI001B88C71B|nr:sodium-dependent lysophosphatidylcholine symporter 1-B-like [Gigantopelta aegis]